MTLALMKTAPHNDGCRCLSYKYCTRKGGGEFTRERVNRLQGAFLSLFQMWRSLLVAAQTVIGLTSAEVQPLGVLHSNTGLAQQQLWLPKNKLCLIRMEPKPSPGPLLSLHVAQRCILQLHFPGSRIHAELQHPCRAAGSAPAAGILGLPFAYQSKNTPCTQCRNTHSKAKSPSSTASHWEHLLFPKSYSCIKCSSSH